jgi:hypothetical protein
LLGSHGYGLAGVVADVKVIAGVVAADPEDDGERR